LNCLTAMLTGGIALLLVAFSVLVTPTYIALILVGASLTSWPS